MSAGYNHILTTIGSNSRVVEKRQNKGLFNNKKHGEQETTVCCLS